MGHKSIWLGLKVNVDLGFYLSLNFSFPVWSLHEMKSDKLITIFNGEGNSRLGITFIPVLTGNLMRFIKTLAMITRYLSLKRSEHAHVTKGVTQEWSQIGTDSWVI